MLARPGLVGKNSSRLHLGPFQANLSIGQKNVKNCINVAYFPWWANGPYSPNLGSGPGLVHPPSNPCYVVVSCQRIAPVAGNYVKHEALLLAAQVQLLESQLCRATLERREALIGTPQTG